jgi:hypothetical protein
MLEELQTLALVGLLVSTYYLTIGCRSIGDSLPHESGHISDKVDGVTTKIAGMTEVLDDIANLLNEGLHSLSGVVPSAPSGSPIEALLSGFISRMTSIPEHGNTLKEEWQVRKDDSPPTLETENQLD